VLVSAIHRAAGLLCRHIERTVLAQAGLRWSAFVTLRSLWEQGELETRRLARVAGVAESTLSHILNQLEQRKLLRRTSRASDRRLVVVDLAPAGAELVSSLLPRYRAEEARAMSRLPSDKVRAFSDALGLILSTMAKSDQADEDSSPSRGPVVRESQVSASLGPGTNRPLAQSSSRTTNLGRVTRIAEERAKGAMALGRPG
jgi:DNA-binding MarR family transcriptional regulator